MRKGKDDAFTRRDAPLETRTPYLICRAFQRNLEITESGRAFWSWKRDGKEEEEEEEKGEETKKKKNRKRKEEPKKKEKKFKNFIDYDKLEEYRDFGGIRIEDNILVTQTGYKVLGRPIPKEVDDVEAWAKS